MNAPRAQSFVGSKAKLTAQSLRLLAILAASAVGLAAVGGYRSAVLDIETAAIDAMQSDTLRINAPITD